MPTFGNPEALASRSNGVNSWWNSHYATILSSSKTTLTAKLILRIRHSSRSEHGLRKGVTMITLFTHQPEDPRAVRSGRWLVLPDWLKRAVVNIKQTTDLHTSALSQSLTSHYLHSGRLPGQIALIRKAYELKCRVLSHHLLNELGDHLTFHQPMGGMFYGRSLNMRWIPRNGFRKQYATAWCSCPVNFSTAKNLIIALCECRMSAPRKRI